MKIKIKAKKEKQEKPIKKILDKRIKLPINVRIGIIALILAILIFSTYSATATDEEKQIKFETITLFSYTQNGDFDYVIYLKNNTVYDNKKTIKPEDNLFAFRNIIDHIEASFKYSYYSNTQSNIKGQYRLKAEILTEQWNKRFILKTGDFENEFIENFKIDYLYYENVTEIINQETGVSTPNPQLVFTFEIYNIEIKTDDYTIKTQSFSPSISIPLNNNIIEFSDSLKNKITGSETENKRNIIKNENQQKQLWTSNTYFFIIIIIIFTTFTRNDTKKLSEIEKQVKKINKKYKEWIVEVDKPPKRPIGTEIVLMKTLDDLIKISEELGKPIIYYENLNEGTFTYYILDNSIYYKHDVIDKEKFIEYMLNNRQE